ncbi:MAG: hypothetical protein IT378_03730 [Sandaracinaceae bacterium]|nr:hypothetical protein [Sandaracinaceae bacterium]
MSRDDEPERAPSPAPADAPPPSSEPAPELEPQAEAAGAGPDASAEPAKPDASEAEPARGRGLVGLAVVFVLAACVLGVSAWTHTALFDFQQLEPEAFDYAWILQYPWRASRGEWSGRDFFYPRGPLWQLVSWAGSGFRFRSMGIAVGGNELAFGLLALGTVPLLVLRTLRGRAVRVLGAAALSVLALYQPLEAFRTLFVTLLVIVLYTLPDESREGSGATLGQGLGAGVVTAITFVLAYERGIIAVVAVGAMALFGTLWRLVRRAPLRPELRRAGAFLVGLCGASLALMLLGAIFDASYLTYLAQMRAIAGAYTVAMQGYESRAGVGVLLSAVALLLLALSVGRARDLPSATLLAGALPSAVSALVRTDPVHIVMGTGVIVGALILIALRQLEARERGLSVGAAILAVTMLAFWVSRDARRVEHWILTPQHFLLAVSGEVESDRSYRGDVPRALAWVRERRAQAPMRCIGLEESLGAIRPLAGVPGPLQLRWTTDLQASVAQELERERCPYYVHRYFTFDNGELIGNWIFGEDFLAVARTYRPMRLLGPSMVAMELRDRPAIEHAHPVEFDEQGEWLTLEVPGSITLALSRPVLESSLVAIEYELEVPEARRYLGGVPTIEYRFDRGEEQGIRQIAVPGGVNRVVRQLLPVDPWAAEWRWVAGLEPRVARSVDRLVLGLRKVGRATPDRVRIRIRAITELRPGGTTRAASWGVAAPADLLEELREHRAFARFAAVWMDRPLTMWPHPDPRFDASLYFPVRPTLGSGLRGVVSLGMQSGDGADLQIWIIDPLDAGNRRVEAATVPLEPGAQAPTRFDVPLDRWVGRQVFVRLAVRPRAGTDGDLVELRSLELGEAPHTRLLAAALERGEARASHAEPRVLGAGDLFLHPNGPRAAPAELILPFTPSPGACLATGLRHGSDRGDGVWMEAEVRAQDESVLLFREHVGPGVERRLPRLSLDPWAGTPIELVLRTRPGISTDFDWATFVAPELELECTDAHPPPARGPEGRAIFAETLDNARRVAGDPRLDHGELFLHPLAPGADPPASIAFPIEPEAGECLELWLRHGAAAGQGDGARLEGRVGDDARSASVLFAEPLAPGESRRVSVSLEAYAGRRTWLTLTSLPGETTTYDWAFFVDPTLAPCTRP